MNYTSHCLILIGNPDHVKEVTLTVIPTMINKQHKNRSNSKLIDKVQFYRVCYTFMNAGAIRILERLSKR